MSSARVRSVSGMRVSSSCLGLGDVDASPGPPWLSPLILVIALSIDKGYARYVGQKIDLMGVQEIAARIGVSRQRVDELHRTDGTFPEPVAVLAAGRIWLKGDIEEWIARRRPSA